MSANLFLKRRVQTSAPIVLGNLIAISDDTSPSTEINISVTCQSANGGNIYVVNNGNVIASFIHDAPSKEYVIPIDNANGLYYVYFDNSICNEVKNIQPDSFFTTFDLSFFPVLEYYTAGTNSGIDIIDFTYNSNLKSLYSYEPNKGCTFTLGSLKPLLTYIHLRKGPGSSITDIHNAINVTYLRNYQANWAIPNLNSNTKLVTLDCSNGSLGETDFGLIPTIRTISLFKTTMSLTTILSATTLTVLSNQGEEFSGSTNPVNFSGLSNLTNLTLKNNANSINETSIHGNLTYINLSINNNLYTPNDIGDMWTKIDLLGTINGTWVSDVEDTPDSSYDTVKNSLIAKGWAINLV